MPDRSQLTGHEITVLRDKLARVKRMATFVRERNAADDAEQIAVALEDLASVLDRLLE